MKCKSGGGDGERRGRTEQGGDQGKQRWCEPALSDNCKRVQTVGMETGRGNREEVEIGVDG